MPALIPIVAGSLYLENLLLNSQFHIWNEGTSKTATNGNSTYGPECWYAKNSLGTNGVITMSLISGDADVNACKVQITTAPTASHANGCEFYQPLLNTDSLPLYNQRACFGVRIKAFGNVNQVGIQFFYATSEVKLTTAIGSEITVAVNTSTYTLGAIINQAIGVAQTTSGIVGVRIRILGVSSGNLYDVNNGFSIEQPIVNKGHVLAAFQPAYKHFMMERAATQRTWESSYDLNVTPGTVTNAGALGWRSRIGGDDMDMIFFKVPKRTSGYTVTAYNNATGASGNWSGFGAGSNQEGQIGFRMYLGSVTDFAVVTGHWVANNRI